MNAFYEHHKESIEFGYRCFDRLLVNGLIQPFQQPERVLGFFNTYRGGQRVTRRTLTEIADQQERRDDFVLPYLRHAETDRVAVILKGREPARILVAIGAKDARTPSCADHIRNDCRIWPIR